MANQYPGRREAVGHHQRYARLRRSTAGTSRSWRSKRSTTIPG
jgi:hypothetical protein